jgi:hypothetical protein
MLSILSYPLLLSKSIRYCEAIATCSSIRSSPYFTTTFGEQFKWLSDRISGTPQIDKTGSWIGGKMSKPSLDSIGTWLEGRFTKLITGDVDSSPLAAEQSATGEQRAFGGPFSHYSTISSATTSASGSPQPSARILNALPPQPPQRSGSAMAYPLVTNSHVPIDRASSAIDYVRRKPSPAPRIASASAATATFAQASFYGQIPNNHSRNSIPNSLESLSVDISTPTEPTEPESKGNLAMPWWGSSYTSDSNARTPTATSYLRVDESRASSSSSGFVSLTEDAPSSATPTMSQHQEPHDEEDDLGFGNPTKREKLSSNDGENETPKPSPSQKAEPEKKTESRKFTPYSLKY